jgi:hypothetical protein
METTMSERLPQNPIHPAPVQPLFPGPAAENPDVPYYQERSYQPAAPEEPIAEQPVYGSPVAAQPVLQRPVAPPPAAVAPVVAAPVVAAQEPLGVEPEIMLVSHSSLFYWWPVWMVGYSCALVTFFEGQTVQLGHYAVNIHTSNNLGVLFFMTLFLVIMISNVVVRGLASALVIMGMVLCAVVFAYMNWWDAILGWVGELTIFLNQGAYFWFSTLMFLVWAFTTFVFDRLSFWRIKPGQMTHVAVFGASSRSYDTENMSFEKHRDDVFRHWLLGMGSGDLTINAFNGGHPETLHIPNVLFIGSKILAIQQLISMKSTEAAQAPAR